VRVKVGGGHAGHNGLRDIIAAAGSPEFARIRVGVGHPPGRQDAADFVLKDFSSTERKDVLPLLLEQSADAIEAVVTAGTAEAQQKFNVR
jgi:PTH1 family peptidyl-tRNA hydrolase